MLKHLYGNNYTDYIEYLVETGFIKKVKGYSTANHTSKQYKLTDELSDVLIYRNFDYILKKKLTKFYDSFDQLDTGLPIPKEICKKLIDDLQFVTIDYEKSISFLQTIKNMNKIKYVKNLSMVNKIVDNDLFHLPDDWGRFHSNFTNLKKEIRERFMTIDGNPIRSLDVKSSQPFFLCQVLKKEILVNNSNEVIKFIGIVERGDRDIYLYFVDRYPDIFNLPTEKENRNIAKDMVIKSMYDQRHKGAPYKQLFRKEFPFILDFMENYFTNFGKELWMTLQKLESEFIFQKVYMSIINQYPEIKMVTVHDSIYFPSQYYCGIKEIWDHYYQEMISKS